MKSAPAALRKAGGKPTNPPMPVTGNIKAGSKARSPKLDKWEVESAMSTLMRADEIRKDNRLMADVKRMAADKAKQMSTICKK